MTIAAFLVAAAIAALVGAWFGEDLGASWPTFGSIAAASATAVFALFPRTRRRWARVVAASVLFVAFWCGWLFGSREAAHAYNEAITTGDDVRSRLRAHRDRTGSYPAFLADLRADLPGRRLLRGSVWRYGRTTDGYVLEVSDWLVTHRATHESGFHAQK